MCQSWISDATILVESFVRETCDWSQPIQWNTAELFPWRFQNTHPLPLEPQCPLFWIPGWNWRTDLPATQNSWHRDHDGFLKYLSTGTTTCINSCHWTNTDDLYNNCYESSLEHNYILFNFYLQAAFHAFMYNYFYVKHRYWFANATNRSDTHLSQSYLKKFYSN